MKTPREILLKRHHAITPKLDAIRCECAGQVSRRFPSEKTKEPETGRMPIARLLWRELIFPSRRIWAGLAAAWLVLAAVDLSQRDHSPASAVKSLPGPEMLLTFSQQEALLAGLIEPGETHAARPPKRFSPQPSSERRLEILMT